MNRIILKRIFKKGWNKKSNKKDYRYHLINDSNWNGDQLRQ